MATYSRNEVWSHRIEYTVPADQPLGATWVEVAKALNAARVDLIEAGELNRLAEAKDDQIRVVPRDESIVIVVELPTERCKS